jgi:hypothetical protein
MQPGKEILDELKELSSYLATLNRVVPFAVPEGYFEGNSQLLLQGVIAANSEHDLQLSVINKTNPYQLPQGYFETLSAKMLSAVTRQNAASLLLPKVNAQEAPEGYFDQLPVRMLAAVKQEQEEKAEVEAPATTKVIPLGNNIWKSVRWAAAAILVAGLGFGSYQMIQPQRVTPKASVEQRLAQMPNAAINHYIQANIDDFDGDMIASVVTKNEKKAPVTKDQLTDKEIIDYLDESGWETSM